MTTPARRWLTRLTTGTTTAGLLVATLPALTALPPPRSRAVEGPPTAAGTLTGMDPDDLRPVSHKARHPHRKIKLYRVQRGDTPGSIAVRYHAWTDQLIAINHTSTLYVGQVIRIPVVVKAARKCKRHENHFTGYLADNKHPDKKQHSDAKPGKKPAKAKQTHKAKSATAHKPKTKHHKRPAGGMTSAATATPTMAGCTRMPAGPRSGT